MTEKLYDANSYLTSFEAKVRSCENTKRGYKILIVINIVLFYFNIGKLGVKEENNMKFTMNYTTY